MISRSRRLSGVFVSLDMSNPSSDRTRAVSGLRHVQVLQTIENRPTALGGMPVELIVDEAGDDRLSVGLDGRDLAEHGLQVGVHPLGLARLGRRGRVALGAQAV